MCVLFILMMTPDCVCVVTRCVGDDVSLVGIGHDGGTDDDAVSRRIVGGDRVRSVNE